MVILMQPPLCKPIEGEYARWGEELDYTPDAYERETPHVPTRLPFLLDSLQYDEDEEMDMDEKKTTTRSPAEQGRVHRFVLDITVGSK